MSSVPKLKVVGGGRVVPRWIALIEKLTHVNLQPDRTTRFRDIGTQSTKCRFCPFWSFFLFFNYIANAISKNSEIWFQHVVTVDVRLHLPL